VAENLGLDEKTRPCEPIATTESNHLLKGVFCPWSQCSLVSSVHSDMKNYMQIFLV